VDDPDHECTCAALSALLTTVFVTGITTKQPQIESLLSMPLKAPRLGKGRSIGSTLTLLLSPQSRTFEGLRGRDGHK